MKNGAWYGWPDYAADLTPVTDPLHRAASQFQAPVTPATSRWSISAKSGLSAPDRSLLVAKTDPHAALGGMTFAPAGGPFSRWSGQLLLSETGDFKPSTDPLHPDVRAGFQVEVVDPATGRRSGFARNRSAGAAQPSSEIDRTDGFERPVDVKVGPDGLVYVLDFGAFQATEKSAKVFPKTGKVFRIELMPPVR